MANFDFTSLPFDRRVAAAIKALELLFNNLKEIESEPADTLDLDDLKPEFTGSANTEQILDRLKASFADDQKKVLRRAQEAFESMKDQVIRTWGPDAAHEAINQLQANWNN